MKKIIAPLVAAAVLASLTACSTPEPERVAATEPKPAPTVTVTAQPKPAPTVTKVKTVEVEVPVEVPVPGPTITVTAAPAPAPSVPDFKPDTHPALKDPYTGAPIPFPTIPAGMHFEEDDVDAYSMWVSFRNFKKIPVGSFAEYRKEYVGTFDDWDKYKKFEEEGGYGLVPLDNGGFVAFREVGRQ